MANLGNEATVSATDVWLTPPSLLAKLGHFDLDPCSPLNRPWDTADKHYTIEDDGLAQQWSGRVWMNPPYGRGMDQWMAKLAEHAQSGGSGIALIFARTETKTFFDHVWDKADAILFIKGRIKFCTPDGKEAGTAGSPSVLIAYGKQEIEVLRNSGIAGKLVIL
jgi:phage N-6-adenine-methyltransferase